MSMSLPPVDYDRLKEIVRARFSTAPPSGTNNVIVTWRVEIIR